MNPDELTGATTSTGGAPALRWLDSAPRGAGSTPDGFMLVSLGLAWVISMPTAAPHTRFTLLREYAVTCISQCSPDC